MRKKRGVMRPRQVMIPVLMLSAVIVLPAGVAVAQSVFRAAPTYQIPGSPGDATALFALVDVGSLDGPLDGILDVVVAERANQAASVKFGKGDGTLVTEIPPNTPLGRIPSAMGVADFDGDHIPDLLIGDLANTVVFFKGTGSADLPPFVEAFDPIPAGIGPAAIAAADVNNDGKVDAIVVDEGNNTGGVTVLLGQGNGSFTQSACSRGTNANKVCSLPADCPGGSCVRIVGEMFPAGGGSTAVAIADFDHDGKLDLAVVNRVSNSVTIMRGAGTGSFATVQTIDVGEEPIAIAAHDLNNDGYVDLVVANTSDNVAVLDGLANGLFGTARYFVSGSAGSQPTGLALADVNHDGVVDALVPNRISSDASVLLGDGNGNFAAARTFVADQQPVAIAAGDMNGDGVPDVVCLNQGTAYPDAAVLISRGDGGLDGVEDVATQSGPSAVVGGDVDNDGVADLIVAHSSGIILVYPAQPPLGFAAPISLQSAGDAAAIGRGDFNADGRLDIVAVNRSTSNLTVFLAQAAGGFGGARNYPIGSGATAVVVGDWNHDGRSDLAVAEQGTGPTGAVEILLAAADGSFGAPRPFPVGLKPRAVDVGDFNEDGRLDLAVANNASNDVSILKGNGDGTFTVLPPIPNVKTPLALVVGDFDADRHDDVAVVAGLQTVLLYFGNGQGSFTLGQSSLSVDTASALAARDINGDSIPDLLVSEGGQSNAVAMFTSLGTRRRFSRDDAPAVGRQPSSVIAADLDGDGRYDGAAANSFGAGSVSVLTNIIAPPVLRGDGNGDAVVSAADAVAVMRELADGNGGRIEDVKRGGRFPAAPGVDANGDGMVTLQDALAVAHRLFPRSQGE